jgi:hypothetical protein
VGKACSTNREEKERIKITGKNARGKDTTRKTKTEVDGSWRHIVEKCGLDCSGSG